MNQPYRPFHFSPVMAATGLLFISSHWLASCSSSSSSSAEMKSAPAASTTHETLAQLLNKRNLTICDAYQWIGEMEAKTRETVEHNNLVDTPLQRETKLEKLRDQRWGEYAKSNGIPDSMRVHINGYGLEECEQK